MNIAFDAVALLGSDSRNRGIGNYNLNLIQYMLESDSGNQYYFVNLVDSAYRLEQEVGDYENLTCLNYFCGRDNFLLRNHTYQEMIGGIIRNVIRDYKIDVFIITSPANTSFCRYQREWFEETRVVTLVYDIVPYIMRQEYFTGPNAELSFQIYMQYMEVLGWSDKILAISNSVKTDLVTYLQISEEKIEVIYGAANEIYREVEVSNQRKKELQDKFNISTPFIICTGGSDFRKNLEGLIVAYSMLPQELIEQYQLVIVCKLSKERVSGLNNLIRLLQVTDRVILTNFVETEELLDLYNMATLLAFPSLYEGLGLPVIEAWACGIPVLTSDNSSLGEIAEGAGELVNPYDTLDIKRGLEKLLTQMDLTDLIQKGKVKLQQFQWKRVAEHTIQMIKELGETPISKAQKQETVTIIAPAYEVSPDVKQLCEQIINELEDLGRSSEIFVKEIVEEKLQKGNIIYIVGMDEVSQSCYPYMEMYPGIIALAADDVLDFFMENTGDIDSGGMKLARLLGSHCMVVLTKNQQVRRKLLRNNIGVTVTDNIENALDTGSGNLNEEVLYEIGMQEVVGKGYSVEEARALARTLAMGK